MVVSESDRIRQVIAEKDRIMHIVSEKHKQKLLSLLFLVHLYYIGLAARERVTGRSDWDCLAANHHTSILVAESNIFTGGNIMFVGVAYESGNKIPKMYGETEKIEFLRFDLDEDMIYAATHLEIKPDQLAETVKVQKVEAFVYDGATSEVEKQLESAGIKTIAGKSGDCRAVATELFVKI